MQPNSSFRDGVQFASDSTLSEQKKVTELFQKITVNEKGCWICHLAPNAKGYSPVSLGQSRKERAHRLVYQVVFGKINSSLVVMHTCDVRNCINPEHLVAGTVADNQQDMAHKGRAYTGGRPTQFRLNEDAWILHKEGKSLAEIGAIQGVGKTTALYRVNKGKEIYRAGK